MELNDSKEPMKQWSKMPWKSRTYGTIELNAGKETYRWNDGEGV